MKHKVTCVGLLFSRNLFPLATVAIMVGSLWCVQAARNPNPGIAPPNSHPYGHSYGEWAAALWKHAIDLPAEGNPFTNPGANELTGSVWFLAAPITSAAVETSVPAGKALLVPAIIVECSSLEPPESGWHGDTEEEQRECAAWWADHIVDLMVEIDGVPVQSIESYRTVSPQFTFLAPEDNILGVPGGGEGTSVADGYYLILAPLSKGGHTIRIQGAFFFSVEDGDPFDDYWPNDVTFHLWVE